jgi:hypothetical protein
MVALLCCDTTGCVKVSNNATIDMASYLARSIDPSRSGQEQKSLKFYMDDLTANGANTSTTQVWIVPQDPETHAPISPQPPVSQPLHPFNGFYIQYPDEDRSPPERGLVSTISDDPPMLNWIYVDRGTHALRYGNRTASIKHIIGPWDWTEDQSAVMLEDWEGFVAVDEGEEGAEERDGLRWALYFDRDDDGLRGGKLVGGKKRVEVRLLRRIQSEEEARRQLEEAEKKMQVKSRGGLKTQFTAPARERGKGWRG